MEVAPADTIPGQAQGGGGGGGQQQETAVTAQPMPAASKKKSKEETHSSIGMFELQKAPKIIVQQVATGISTGCCGYEGENAFEITDAFGHKILFAKEESGCCTRQCCNENRSFQMAITDRQDNVVIGADRPLRCDNCFCCPCLNQQVTVECPPGRVVGFIEQTVSLLSPTFDIKDSRGNLVYVVDGPSRCVCNCGRRFCCCPKGKLCCFTCGPSDVEFVIKRQKDRQPVGLIARKWAGGVGDSDMQCELDRFGISFPDGVDVNMKAVFIVTCMLVDYLYFEDSSGLAPS